MTRRLALALLSAGSCALAACPGTPVSTCEGESCQQQTTSDNPPRMYIAPAFGIGFDCVAIGCDQSREVRVENRGGGLLSLISAELIAGTSADFSLANGQALPVDLAAGQQARLSVTYRPLDADKDEGALRLFTAAQPSEGAVAGLVELPLRVRQNGDPVIALFRNGDLPDERVDLSHEDYVLNFGYVAGGTVGRLEMFVCNQTAGNAILELYEVVPGDRFESAFYLPPLDEQQHLINPQECTPVELQLLPGSTPADLRLYDADILVHSSDPIYSEISVRLFGTAKNVPVIEVQPESLDLGSTRFQTPKSASLELRNAGGLDLVVTPRLVAGGNVGFLAASDGVTHAPIGPFESVTLSVSLDASVGGAVTGLLRLDSNDPLHPRVDVPLSAFVEAPLIAVQPDPVAFGSLVQGWTSGNNRVEVRNIGHGALDISDIRMEVGSSSQFSLSSVPGVPLQLFPEDPPLIFELSYTAFTLGPTQGLLIVESNSIDYRRSEVAVTGTGVTCEQGCALPNASPSCFSGACEIASCSAGWHDANGDGKDGCECREESPEVGAFCSAAHDVGVIKDSQTTRSGNLHEPSDVDMYYFYAADKSDLCFPWQDDGSIEVSFTSAPAGIEFCVSYVNHQPSGDGCGLGSEQCGLRSWSFDNTSCGGDDDRDVTVRVRVTPGQEPGCADYTLRFKSSM